MNYKVLTGDLILWIKDWFEENGKGCKAVIGISGGVKSAITCCTLCTALGSENVIGITMRDEKDPLVDKEACDVCNYYKVKHYDLAVYPAMNALKNVLNLSCKVKMTEQAVKNLPARMRMVTLYLMSQTLNGRVINTSCLSDNYIGNVTLWGDSVGDMSPFGLLTLDEMLGVATELCMPQRFIFKKAEDKLPGSKPDEEKFGFQIKDLDEYIRTGTTKDQTTKEKIDALYNKNKFKMYPIPTFNPNLNIYQPQ